MSETPAPGEADPRPPLLDDRRTMRPVLWNVQELCGAYGLRPPDSGARADAMDAFIYDGYRKGGSAFLAAVEGRFASVYHDRLRGVIFLARDWIGEQPLHVSATPRGLVVANTVANVMRSAGDLYDYRYVRAFPQAKCLEVDVSRVDPECVAETLRYGADTLYFDLEGAVRDSFTDLDSTCERAANQLRSSIRRRLGGDASEQHVLLSGGLDSLSVALVLRDLGVRCVAHTLAIGDGGDDVIQASAFARALGIPHDVIRVSASEVRSAAKAVVEVAETYHLYNFYCSVGMYLLGRGLAAQGIDRVWCGEAVNEALGDYHDWTVRDPLTGEDRVLQRVNYERMRNVSERLLYVWGQSRDRGKYNRQLGTGLAKHAGARMTKPLAAWGVTLECPYYDKGLLATLIALPAPELEGMGGKPGLFLRTFRSCLERQNFPEQLVTGCRKVRLQDASEGGRGGITPVLMTAGLDQHRLIHAFNAVFRADLNPRLETWRLAGAAPGFGL